MRFVPRILAAVLALAAGAAAAGAPATLATVERDYLDAADAHAAVATIDSGLEPRVDGADRATWARRLAASLARLQAALPPLERASGLAPEDRRAVAVMRANLDGVLAGRSLAPSVPCARATRADLPPGTLREAIYTCFDAHARAIPFEGRELSRITVFQQLSQLEDAARRRALFLAMQPLWRSINGDDGARSPYRRMLAATVAERGWRSPVDEAAATLGIPGPEVGTWLVRMLEAWSRVDEGREIEPWDYRYVQGAAARALARCIPRERVLEATQAYYRDLGADLTALGVRHDLDVRPGKAPLAYTDVVRYGREVGGRWRPAVPRVSANLQDGGLEALNELVHEEGHAVQFAAVRSRPAFAAGGGDDALYWEAFADVPSWAVYDPAWQRRYLGCEADAADSLRARWGGVMLDVAWGLFEVRMLADPRLDPNAVWTEITHRYLHVVPHPELSWWAVRAQLAHDPGYLVTYALGAALTSDLRTRTAQGIGAFDTGNPAWYPWLAEHLLGEGARRPPAEQLATFLGRPPSVDAALADLARVGRAPPPAPDGARAGDGPAGPR
jgi:hypothetical protein